MDLLREWIVRIAGIIILFTLCDMIMIEGEIKKYIKPIFGIILVLAIIRPLSGDITEHLDFEESYSSSYGATLLDEMTLKQEKTIKELYEKKIADETKKIIIERYNLASTVKVCAEEKEDGFGTIDLLEIKLEAKEGVVVNIEEIKRHLEKELGTAKSKITITF